MKQLLYIILVISFGIFSTANAQNANLLVDFSASPSSGLAPLNNVDFTAVVSGTATGAITYRFDCTGDDAWDHTYTSSGASYTAYNICSYANPGEYTAKAMVEREGLSFQGSIGIHSTEPASVPVAQAATSVSTGAFNPVGAALIISIIIGFLISWFLLLRFYVKNHVLPKAFQQKATRDLESVISRISKRARA